MAEKSWAGGVVMVYGVAIGNALASLAKGQGGADDLIALRDQTRAIVTAQGDLVAALKDLEAEIARRQAGTKSAPPPASERFVAQIDGLHVPDSVKAEIEQALQKAVMTEIAKLDQGGDLVATPLAKAKLFPGGGGLPFPGVMGLVIAHPNLR